MAFTDLKLAFAQCNLYLYLAVSATPLILPVCPLSVMTERPRLSDQMRTVRSLEPEASRRILALRARHSTLSRCSFSTWIWRRVVVWNVLEEKKGGRERGEEERNGFSKAHSNRVTA